MDERGVDWKEQSPAAIIGTQVEQKSALVAIAPKCPNINSIHSSNTQKYNKYMYTMDIEKERKQNWRSQCFVWLL